MEHRLFIGIEGQLEITVTDKDTAARYGSGLIEVFATPAMIGLMESCAQQSIMPYLPEGFITLGIEINVKHLKATPIGMKVKCHSKLIAIDEKKLTFDIEAHDEKGLIGTAQHIRYIVNAEKFMQKLKNNS